MRRPGVGMLAPAALASLLSGAAHAATVTTYNDEAAFLAALGPAAQRYNADGQASGTPLTTQVAGIAFSSPNAALAGAIPVQVQSSSGAASRPNLVSGGYISGSPGIPQTIVLQFSPYVTAFGAALSSLTPDSVNAMFVATFQDATSQSFPLKTSGSKAVFLGLKADTAITRIEYVAAKGNGGQTGFKNFGIDNLTWLPGDGSVPLCSAEKAVEAGVLGFNGTSTDQAPGDTGIASVTLTAGVNVSLTCSSPFPAACGTAAVPAPSVSWRVAPSAPGLDGSGTVVATDTQGQSCSFDVTFTAFGGGETDDLVVCRDTGIILQVSNGTVATPGQIVCGSTFPGPGEPPYPAGYEPSPDSDPFPCPIFTIKSPISGITAMTLKKDGDFEPRLRLLFSRFDGATFPPFSDITESVEQIDNIIPDPTRVKGSGGWSQVKVACAVQAEVCNGLDDDGDGDVDEGIPEGAQAIDCDHDGYPLCATGASTAIDCSGNTVPLIPGAAADCNDNIAAVNAGAEETCNGLDDDCDGAIDEGAPAGG
ncbi:MAG TPA: MopE-related protein, partial [Candidatus Polarisedimenticolia bacterium]|nr:MopE-related protein [Candidatus Polarisedimenticolia bacterium]